MPTSFPNCQQITKPINDVFALWPTSSFLQTYHKKKWNGYEIETEFSLAYGDVLVLFKVYNSIRYWYVNVKDRKQGSLLKCIRLCIMLCTLFCSASFCEPQTEAAKLIDKYIHIMGRYNFAMTWRLINANFRKRIKDFIWRRKTKATFLQVWSDRAEDWFLLRMCTPVQLMMQTLNCLTNESLKRYIVHSFCVWTSTVNMVCFRKEQDFLNFHHYASCQKLKLTDNFI